MAITIDGIEVRQPTQHGWIPPDATGRGMDGDDIFTGVWEYSLEWGLIEPDKYAELWTIYQDNIGSDVTASLPELGASTYTNKNYTVRVNMLLPGVFFNGAWTGVSMRLSAIDITA